MSGHWLRITRAARMPSSVWVGGIRTSAITTSGCSRSTAASSPAASAAVAATSNPALSSSLVRPASSSTESSAITTRRPAVTASTLWRGGAARIAMLVRREGRRPAGPGPLSWPAAVGDSERAAERGAPATSATIQHHRAGAIRPDHRILSHRGSSQVRRRATGWHRREARTVAQTPESGVQSAPPSMLNPAGWAAPARWHSVAFMTTIAAARYAPIRRRDRVPWSPRAWRQALYLTGGIPVLAAVPLLMLAGATARPRWSLPLLFLAVALLAVPLLGKVHRHRLRATAGVLISPPPMMPNGLSMAAIQQAIRSPVTWRQLGYHFLAAPALAVAALAAFGMWLAGLLYTLVYVYAWALAPQRLLARGQSSGPPGHLAPMSNIPVDAYITVVGLMLLVAAPWLTAGVVALDVRAARTLLGPSRAEELEHRVEHLTQTRAGA